MDTGVLSIIFHQFPYPSHWTRVISTIMFVLNIVLSLVIFTIYLLRWTLFSRDTFRLTSTDAEQLALQACPSITWITLTIQVQLTCAQAWGYGWTIASICMWWIALVWVLGICTLLYLHLIKKPSHSLVDKWLPTAVFIPIVAVFTLANAGGLIVNGAVNDTHLHPSLAVPIILVGFLLVGFGLGLAVVMYAVYMHRLMTSGFPESLKIPAMILTIGPCGQSATALIGLGNAAVAHADFASYDRGTFLTEATAPVLRTMCILAALLLTGFAIFWMLVDYYALVSGFIRREIKPSLFWWSSIFPVGTVVTALSGLGNAMDSVAFKVCACILLGVLVVIYLVNAVMTVPMTLSGKFLGLEHGFHHEFKRLEKWETETGTRVTGRWESRVVQ
jgi:tellurite resistance protein TehA-like permease